MPKHPLYQLLLVMVVVITACRTAVGATATAALFAGLTHRPDGAVNGQADDGQYNNSSHSVSLV